MSTNSTIAVLLKSGKVKEIYCHWDGDVACVGNTLYTSYSDYKKMVELVSFGNVSSLGANIHPFANHSFERPESGVTVFYGRDRGGDDGIKAYTYKSLEDYFLNGGGEEYNYLFADGVWTVESEHFNVDKLYSLEGKLKEIEMMQYLYDNDE